MATSKILVFSIFLALLFSRITADAPLPNDGASASAPEVADSSLKLQLELLQLKVSLLESSLDEKNRELKEKDESIRQVEKIIQEKSNSIALIQSGIESVQAHGGWLLHTFAVHIGNFQSYIVTYWNELGRPALDLGIEKALEMKTQVEVWAELNIESIRTKWIPSLKKQSFAFIAYLKPHIQSVATNTVDVYHSSKSSIAPLVFKVQKLADPYIQEAKKFTNPYIDQVAMVTRPHLDSIEAHGGWLLHTFAVHIGNFQSYIVTYWNELGRPALDLGIEKALEMKTQVEVWAELNIESIRTKWIPSLKKQSFAFIAYLKPHIQSVTTNTVDVYHSSKSSIAPLVFKVQKLADPYIQEAKKFTDPYIDQVAMVTRPNLDQVHVVLQPCAEKVIYAYGQFIRTATFYHHEVEEMLKGNEFTQSLASMEVAWFAAAALLALPAVFLFKLYLAIFRKQTKKRSYNSQENHTRRRLKRAYPAK